MEAPFWYPQLAGFWNPGESINKIDATVATDVQMDLFINATVADIASE